MYKSEEKVELQWREESNMIMYHGVFLCFTLLVSWCLYHLPNLSTQSLKIGSLNINGGRDRHKRTLISEDSTQKRINLLFFFFFFCERHILIQEKRPGFT